MFTIPSLIITCLIISAMVLFNFENQKDTSEEKKIKDINLPIIFTGDSMIYSWRNIEQDLEPLNVINRGIPEIKTNELLRYIDDLLLKYNPKSIVFYIGSKEIKEFSDQASSKILESFESIVTKILKRRSNIKIFYISLLPSMAKSMWGNRTQIIKSNTVIKEFCNTFENIHFLDAESYFRYASGLAKLKYFEKDRIHLNEKGYKLLAAVIIRYLQIK